MALKRALDSPNEKELSKGEYIISESEGRSCGGGGRARTFEGNTRVLCALNALFDDAKLGLRQLPAVGGESALVLLVDRQALSGPEAECDNLGLYGFNCSAQFIVVFDSLQV